VRQREGAGGSKGRGQWGAVGGEWGAAEDRGREGQAGQAGQGRDGTGDESETRGGRCDGGGEQAGQGRVCFLFVCV
jgi:hypothetical protein